MQFKDYYEVLGVGRGATADEIRRAYRKLAQKFHPDINKSADASAKFSEINEAHEVLSDPEKRKQYDLLGQNWKNGQEFTPPPGSGGFEFNFGQRDGGGGFSPGGFSEFFEAFFGSRGGARGRGQAGEGFSGFEDLLGGNGRGSRGGARTSHGRGEGHQAEDAQVELEISLDEAFHGASRQVKLRMPDGSLRSIDLKIPSGTADGDRLRLRGEGVTIRLKILPHARLRLDGRDIHVRHDIAPWQAALGGSIAVHSLDGLIELEVPAGSSSGRKLRVKGRGLPARAGVRSTSDAATPGNLYIELRIAVPSPLSDEERALYEQMKALSIVEKEK